MFFFFSAVGKIKCCTSCASGVIPEETKQLPAGKRNEAKVEVLPGVETPGTAQQFDGMSQI